MIARFTIDGEPMGKERPRSNRYTKAVYTPEKTANYEEYARWCYSKQCKDIYFEQGSPVTVVAEAYLGIPKSTTKKRRKEILETEEIPTKKPDTDNILKIIKDALNEVAYYDDAQVGTALISKYYSENPRVEVTILDGTYIRNFLMDIVRTYKANSVVARFTIDGEPMGKERPRFDYYTKSVHTPEKTANYEEYARWCYSKQCKDIYFEQGMPVTVVVEAYLGIPKSTTKKRRKEILETEEIPTKKPDTDNILKIIKDALNEVAYYDDAQVGTALISKYYSENPRVEVTILDGTYIRNFLMDIVRTYKE